MTSSPRSLRVIIIGAGTGGLCLAHGLHRAGIDVAVYERDRTRTDGLQGFRVGIGPDGNRALHECLPPELFQIFAATAGRSPRSMNFVTENLQELLSFPVEEDADPILQERSVSRMTMRQVLLTGLDDIVHFDKKFTHYQQHADGTVTAHFADGSTASGDLLVAADGSNSLVRKQYLPHAQLQDTGIVAMAGKAPLTVHNRHLLPEKLFTGIGFVLAKHGFTTILHVMELPWRQEHVGGIGGTDPAMLAAWPGVQFDNTRDYIMWGFSGAAKRLPRNFLEYRGEDAIQMILRQTHDWDPRLRELFRQTDPSTVFPINIRTSVRLDPWPSSNVTLLGDAIHTMTPGRGVGANTALRDAALLCRTLVEIRDGRIGLVEGVHDYEAEMIAYGFSAVQKSLEQMSADSPLHSPVVGRVALAGQRFAFRLVNALPFLKKRMVDGMQEERGHTRTTPTAAAATS